MQINDSALVLAGDIGGTKTNLAVYAMQNGAPSVIAEQNYLNRNHASITEIVRIFLEDTGYSPRIACFDVAGAIVDGICDMPNLGWHLDEKYLAGLIGMRQVKLLNDLEATAYGITALRPDQLVTLNEGTQRSSGNMALIAAGTGLGEAILFPSGKGYNVSASEGGHADYAPRNDREIELFRFLSKQYGRVSYERVISGPGLRNIYSFLQEKGDFAAPAWLLKRLSKQTDASAEIAEAALNHEADICIAALEQFMAIYGAETGNLALKALATGGIYIGGGIAPKILPAFSESGFMAAFLDKGRFSGLLADIPVQVIIEPKTALLGAAAYMFSELDR
jgi:glucokinase